VERKLSVRACDDKEEWLGTSETSAGEKNLSVKRMIAQWRTVVRQKDACQFSSPRISIFKPAHLPLAYRVETK
jgi:hypothetical protein